MNLGRIKIKTMFKDVEMNSEYANEEISMLEETLKCFSRKLKIVAKKIAVHAENCH